jgi:hypothetical protein
MRPTEARSALDQAAALEERQDFLDRPLADRQRVDQLIGERAMTGGQHAPHNAILQFLVRLFRQGRSENHRPH